jgi:predicted nicotinamide N-methyase
MTLATFTPMMTEPAAEPPPSLEVVEEDVELGPVVGTLRLRQLAPRSFNDACKSTAHASHDATDCTGQRVYAGCQTMVRFLAGRPWLVRGKSVVELGCGVGACGLAVAGRLGAARVVLTDGQPSTLLLARANAEALGLLLPQPQPQSQPELQSRGRVSVRRLLFGTDGCQALLAAEGLDVDGGADVVVGCELMYYNVDPTAVLTTAAALVRRAAAAPATAEGNGDGNGDGVILLAHIFRGAHLPQSLADAAEVRSGRMGLVGCRHVMITIKSMDRSTDQLTD